MTRDHPRRNRDYPEHPQRRIVSLRSDLNAAKVDRNSTFESRDEVILIAARHRRVRNAVTRSGKTAVRDRDYTRLRNA